MVMVVPTVGKPAWPCCSISSFTGATFVAGCASEMTAMSFPRMVALKPVFRKKLVMPVPGPAMGANEIDGFSFGVKQCAAVRIVRELISEPVQNELFVLGSNRLTTLGNWLLLS